MYCQYCGVSVRFGSDTQYRNPPDQPQPDPQPRQPPPATCLQPPATHLPPASLLQPLASSHLPPATYLQPRASSQQALEKKHLGTTIRPLLQVFRPFVALTALERPIRSSKLQDLAIGFRSMVSAPALVSTTSASSCGFKDSRRCLPLNKLLLT